MVPTSVKYVVFPVSRNQLWLRLENIGDRFDTDRFPNNFDPNDTTIRFPLDQFARNLFARANWNTPAAKYNLTNILYQELSLTGNQLYSEVNAGKTNWRIQGQPNATLSPFSPATEYTMIELPQQRIRMFNVTYLVSLKQSEEKMEQDKSFLY